MNHRAYGAVQTESEFASANVTASESFSSIRTVAAFSMESQIQDLYNDLLTAPAKAASKTALIGCVAVRDAKDVVTKSFGLAESLCLLFHSVRDCAALLRRGIGFGYADA